MQLRNTRRACVVAAMVLCGAPAAAQGPGHFALDSVFSVDAFDGENVSSRPQVIVDIAGSIRMGGNLQAYFRPWFRLPRPNAPGGPAPEWIKELWQAGVRYERPGDGSSLAARIDIGYNVSPIGLGVMDTRPSLNPTIATHMSYVLPMPAFDLTVPRVSAIAGTYPLGAQLAVSSTRWDARGAILNSAPTRNYAVGRAGSPRQTPVFVVGAGLTPAVGLRVGVSLAHGDYATAEEVAGPFGSSRAVTIVGGEAEYAFGYTKISGEFVRSRFERTEGHAIAYEYFAQGVHTITPRWFAAARYEGTSAPPLVTPAVVGEPTRLDIVEATVGFRVTPEVTLRSSYYTRRSYGASWWDRQVAASAVWARRWW